MKKFIVEFKPLNPGKSKIFIEKTIEVKADTVDFQGDFVAFKKNNKDHSVDVIVAYNSENIIKVYNPELHKTD